MSRLASNLSGGQSSTQGSEVGNFRGKGKPSRKGKVSESIVAALKSSKKPLSADEIFAATGSKSKPSVSQTLMKMVHSGQVQRHNAEGKPISKNDKSQRAKGYSLA
ncbi:MAG: hypothetical protein ACREJD_08370 [Phycisphaerales bacterium]